MSLDAFEALKAQDPKDLTPVGLQHAAAPLARVFAGRLPTASEIKDLTSELGVELATAVFLQTVNDSASHGPFSRAVRSFQMSTWNHRRTAAQDIEVIIVASNLFQSERQWRDHVDTWRGWARALGFTTDVIETESQLSVLANARLISQHLIDHPHPNRILVTYGQGANEFRYLLQQRLNLEREDAAGFEVESIRAWINVCGSYAGSESSRYLSAGRLRRFWTEWRMKRAHRNPAALLETSNEFGAWTRSAGKVWRLPIGMMIINLIGLPLRTQMSRPGVSPLQYNELARTSPNDGVLRVHEMLAPGLIIALAGMSHRAEASVLEPIFKRVLGVVLNRFGHAYKKDQRQIH